MDKIKLGKDNLNFIIPIITHERRPKKEKFRKEIITNNLINVARAGV